MQHVAYISLNINVIAIYKQMKKLLFFVSAVALLASCSKDLIEENATFLTETGKTKIVAYNTVGNDTRTHLGEKTESGTYPYEWDNGDALGLFNAKGDDDTNAYFGYSGTGNEFTGELEMLTGETYYAYYPWSRNVSLNGTSIEMFINAKQKYSHKYSSFAATEAPAIATGVAPKEGENLELKFSSVVSYLRVPMVGVGKVKSLTLGFGDKNTLSSYSRNKYIAGPFNVDFTEEKLSYYTTDMEVPTSTSKYQKWITLDCAAGVDLDPVKPTNFWFVVPAGLELGENNYANIWVNVDGDPYNNGSGTAPDFSYQFTKGYAFKANLPVKIGDKANTVKDQDNAYTWTEGDKLLISQPLDLLKYFYYATEGINGAEAKFVKDGALKAAVLVNDIDLSDVLERLYQDQFDELSLEEQAVYLWYVHISEDGENASYHTPTVGGKVAYDISAYDKNGAIVSGWNVKGNGLFTGNGSVKGVTFKNVHVDATEVEDDAIYFLAKSFNEQDLTLEVNVGDGCTLAVAEDATGALVGTVNASDTLPKDVELPTYAGTEDVIAYTYTFNINKDIVMADYEAVTYNKITVEDTPFITLALADDVEGFMKDVINADSANWYSVLAPANGDTKELTSYWTGLIPSSKPSSNIMSKGITAEILAYANKSGRSSAWTLTNDINLMNKSWKAVTANTSIEIAGANKTISNVKIFEPQSASGTAYYALFGGAAKVTNLTVDGIEIVAPAKVKNVAGIAVQANKTKTGAENVTVKGLKIDASASSATEVGGIFSVYQYVGTVKPVIKNCTVETVAGGIKLAKEVVYGDLAGKYDLKYVLAQAAQTNVYEETFEAGTTACSNKLFGKIAITNDSNELSTDATLNINGTFTVAPASLAQGDLTFAGDGGVYYHTFELDVNKVKEFKVVYRDGKIVEL